MDRSVASANQIGEGGNMDDEKMEERIEGMMDEEKAGKGVNVRRPSGRTEGNKDGGIIKEAEVDNR